MCSWCASRFWLCVSADHLAGSRCEWVVEWQWVGVSGIEVLMCWWWAWAGRVAVMVTNRMLWCG